MPEQTIDQPRLNTASESKNMEDTMSARTNRIFMIIMAATLIIAILAGVANALTSSPTLVQKASLSNVRDYAAAVADTNYAVDSGVLFAGGPQGWLEVKTPDNIIVGAVAIDKANPKTIYVGAADSLNLYRSTDGGEAWMRVPLTEEYVGGVTDIAVDSVQRLVYVGTDTAGLFRLRDVGSSMIVGGHLQLDEPVVEVAADNTGAGLAFARTARTLYRAENFGLSWYEVENLGSAPTALAIADSSPATVYVGTVDRGVVQSHDGLTWTMANEGLNLVPGSRLYVDALAVDPQQPNVIYVATSYLYGTTEVHHSPVGVAMTTDNGQEWAILHSDANVAVAGLLPVSGLTGAVYAVTDISRTPQPLGSAPAVPAEIATTTVVEPASAATTWTGVISWIVALLAALALLVAVGIDLRNRRRPATGGALAPNPVRNH
jgi:photosystem II stability/assembly factor-like uncharacterized protein